MRNLLINIKFSKLLAFFQVLLIAWFIVVLPLMVADESIYNPLQNTPVFFGLMYLPFLLASVLILLILRFSIIKIKLIDVFLFLFVFYQFLLRDGECPTNILSLVLLVFLYFSIRIINKQYSKYVLTFIIISAASQAIYGQLQLYDVLYAHHTLYGITGSFFNPAPFAGYLCMAFPVALVYYFRRNELVLKHKKPWVQMLSEGIKYFLIIALLAMLVVLPAARSRASWLAVLLVGYLILTRRCSANSLLKNYHLRNKIAAILIPLVLVMALTGIYWLKKDSADGRLLIWQASASMLKEKPLLGWGKNGFEAYYMLHQAKFFDTHPNHAGVALADNVQYAYNELLKVTVEYGLVGLALVLSIIYSIIQIRGRSTALTASKHGLLALLVFSMFSYPSDILAIKVNVVILLGIVASYSKELFTLGKLPTKVIASILLLGAVLFYPKAKETSNTYYQALTHWRDASDIYRVEAYEECFEDFELAYPVLKEDGNFLVQYGKALSMANNDSLAIEVLEGAKQHLNNTILYTALGDSYARLGAYEDAEQSYQMAYAMVPNRFYPLYLLAKMYDESGQDDKAVEVSQQILSKKIKVESRAIDEIKELAEDIINRNQ